MAHVRIFGTPGAALVGSDFGPTRAIAAGTIGEQRVGAVLERLADEIEHLYVFHSLRPKRGEFDADHIVVYGDFAIVIDAKMWPESKTYVLRPDGRTVLQSGLPFEFGQVKVRDQMTFWQRQVPGRKKMFGAVVIASTAVKATGHSHNVQLLNLLGIDQWVRDLVATQSPQDVTRLSDEELQAWASFTVKLGPDGKAQRQQLRLPDVTPELAGRPAFTRWDALDAVLCLTIVGSFVLAAFGLLVAAILISPLLIIGFSVKIGRVVMLAENRSETGPPRLSTIASGVGVGTMAALLLTLAGCVAILSMAGKFGS